MTSSLAAVAAETAAILAAGGYTSPGGRRVELGPALDAAVAGTRLYEPEERLGPWPSGRGLAALAVTGETTLAAARRLAEDGGAGRPA
jgi:uncharacterized protein (TIGR02452 family)